MMKEEDNAGTAVVEGGGEGEGEGDEEADGAPRKKKAKVNKQLKIEKMLMPYKPMPTRRVDVFFQRQFQDIMSKTWTILQISEARNARPGEFRMWTLVDGAVHQVTLDVPRTFYVNYFTDPSGSSGSGDTIGAEHAVLAPEMVLPRSKVRDVLYRYTMSEPEFQAKQKDLSKLQTNPNVEGVYETQVPPLLRALSRLGCVCRVSPAAKRPAKDIRRMSLDNLEFVNANSVTYLAEPLKAIYVYHRKCRLGRGHMAVLGVYFAEEKKACVYCVGGQDSSAPPPATARIAGDGFEITASARLPTLEDAYKEAEGVLNEFYTKGHLSYILVANTPFTERGLEDAMPTTANYPKLFQPCDERASETVVLKWEAEELAKMHKEFRGLSAWLADKVSTSHFSHVPVGNIGDDEVITISDIMFARELQQNHHVLWVSQSNRPDLGGAQEDDNTLATAAAATSSDELSREVCVPGCYRTVCAELSFSELTLSAIMKAESIIEGEGIASIFAFTDNFADSRVDASDGRARDIMTAKTFGGSIEGIRPFKELAKMVHSWMNVAAADEDAMFKFLGNLYRWITSARSRFYEPAIIKIVTDLMNKLFLQLVHTVRTLGGGIVYANFNKIVVDTHKYAREDAENFLAFIIDSVKKERLYESLSFEVKYYWDVLLFMDLNNYCGVIVEPGDPADSAPLSLSNSNSNGEDSDDLEDVLAPVADAPGERKSEEEEKEKEEKEDPPTQELKVQKPKDVYYKKCQWSIAEYLPVEFQPIFSNVVLFFIDGIVSMKAKRMVPHESSSGDGLVSIMLAASAVSSADRERASVIASKSAGISEYLSGNTLGDDDDVGSNNNSSSSSSAHIGYIGGNLSRYSPVNSKFTQSVFDTVREMLVRLSKVKGGSENDKFNYIQGPDSVKKPFLIFTNLLCQTLSIDKCSENKVSRLKSGMLKLLDISMFSPEAEFKITGSSLIIPGVICKNCLALK